MRTRYGTWVLRHLVLTSWRHSSLSCCCCERMRMPCLRASRRRRGRKTMTQARRCRRKLVNVELSQARRNDEGSPALGSRPASWWTSRNLDCNARSPKMMRRECCSRSSSPALRACAEYGDQTTSRSIVSRAATDPSERITVSVVVLERVVVLPPAPAEPWPAEPWRISTEP